MILSVTATDLPRVNACNGSRLMEGFQSSIKTDDTIRNEGLAAHWAAQQIFKDKFNADELIDRKAPSGVFITAEMIENLHDYLKDIGKEGFIEHEMSFGTEKWRVNCRPDHIVLKDNVLKINEFKYGWGIVKPEMNWTLIAHALAYCINYKVAPQKIVLTIYQPRPYHTDGYVRSWEIDYNHLLELYGYINNVLSNPKNELNTSEHCKDCPALASCPARRKAELNAIDASELLFETEIDNENLSFRLKQINRAIKVLEQNEKAYTEIALHRVRSGQLVEDYGVENDLANRGWKKHVTADLLKVLTGKDLTKKQLITPRQAEIEGVDETIVSTLTERFHKGIKLVRVDANKKAAKYLTTKKG